MHSGHYVRVTPEALPSPRLVAVSEDMLRQLGLGKEGAREEMFAKIFSGDVGVLQGLQGHCWATPYALSIYGQELYDNCPFGSGNGYGDGRAISVGEFIGDGGKRWELQLKGAGRTPFCRGADGRAVLRSSVREFIASEAMHHLGVETTRALSLVVSETGTVVRPWYKACGRPKAEESQVAITTRAATSFIRVGQVELYGRRGGEGRQELEALLKHLIKREYSEQVDSPLSFPEQLLQMARAFGTRLTKLAADWLRVGFTQSNFNSDNCLMTGRTMDYGPFGFIEKFTPFWNMWHNSGDHFGFMNQPKAAMVNYRSFLSSLEGILSPEQLHQTMQQYAQTSQETLDTMWKRKMGTSSYEKGLHQQLMKLLESSEADYTLFWRTLSSMDRQGSPE